MSVTPYHLTPEDLFELDTKTREALTPLLNALNVTIPQLVAAQDAAPRFKELSSTFTSGATGSAYVDLNPAPLRKVRSLVVDQIRRSDGEDMASGWSPPSWTMTASGVVRALFVGLENNTAYYLAVTLK